MRFRPALRTALSTPPRARVEMDGCDTVHLHGNTLAVLARQPRAGDPSANDALLLRLTGLRRGEILLVREDLSRPTDDVTRFTAFQRWDEGDLPRWADEDALVARLRRIEV